jgi:lipoprotein-anchoring transpeptidase ErfK/SrfK
MRTEFSRRDFLKLCGLSAVGVFLPFGKVNDAPLPFRSEPSATLLGRVARKTVTIHDQPDIQSPALYKIERDTLLPLLELITSPSGPQENPRWYRLADGYVHSAYLQRVDAAHQNQPLARVPEGGLLGEVSVPYTQTIFQNRDGYPVNLYRLYYGSVHWITGMVAGGDGEPWYTLIDERLRVKYYAPAIDLRPVTHEELLPISADVPLRDRRIEVSLTRQTLSAYEGGRLVLHTRVSTGRRYTETPTGEFRVNRKCPSKHMGDGGLTSDPNAYELVGVPWTSFFDDSGVAFHGTFWHDNFGNPMSLGCVNMRNEDAKWLFRWCLPEYSPELGYREGHRLLGSGTRVVVK